VKRRLRCVPGDSGVVVRMKMPVVLMSVSDAAMYAKR
jgi:hypothetical protein